ncbi:recombining binding protein suppressor of hairless-like protein isoform X2 [Syngnathoides biaculeatus]|uniref:recombining binding protein suppressor of hairless-like protein isoform X2 n=1 Tax=Syngnathoides biaculeatus TaxID=300417 RepID=UPI002ADDEB0C|nr:recombining binding protein suppressor of hairless-like protein isoform X2 [Syngnathoides biaculeatus]
MDVAASTEDGRRDLPPHHSARFRDDAVTHLLAEGHAGSDSRAAPARPSSAPRGGALGDRSVVILHAKVAQKSYGSEKRFFCPPPCVYVGADVWMLMHELLQAGACGGAVRGYLCVDSAAQTHSDVYKLNFETLPDKDKRKHFRLLLGLFLEVGSGRQEVGSFHGRPIKVISKPSQKRQTMKNADLCISARSRVALFNRLRSQTVSTRYLAVEGGAFVASGRQWTAFTITLLEDHRRRRRAEHPADFVLSEGFVSYGSVVQLVCTETGLTLPPMVIRKVNKQHAVSCADEPVSQLHKCALEMRDSPRAFLAVANDAVVLHRAASGERDAGRALLSDGSCWTVVGVEVVDFAFRRGDGARVRTPVTPFPDVAGLELNGGGHVATLELHGDNFGPHLKVCFGASEADTMFKSTKALVCVVPDVCVLQRGCRGNERGGAVTVPISLRRQCDGVLYSTAFSFTYTPELHQPQRRPTRPPDTDARASDAPRQDDALLESIHHEFTRSSFHFFMQP